MIIKFVKIQMHLIDILSIKKNENEKYVDEKYENEKMRMMIMALEYIHRIHYVHFIHNTCIYTLHLFVSCQVFWLYFWFISECDFRKKRIHTIRFAHTASLSSVKLRFKVASLFTYIHSDAIIMYFI
jgi:hypothetical protein